MRYSLVDKGSAKNNRSPFFVALSVVLHGCIFALLAYLPSHSQKASIELTEIEFVDLPTTKNEEKKLKHQVVETKLTEKSEQAAENAYLGAQTQVVKRQTRAKDTGAYRNAQAGQGGAKGKQAAIKLSDLGVKINHKPMGNMAPGTVASSSDYLQDVDQSAETLLNTKEYAYYSFYQRVRLQLEQFWEPGLKERLRNMFNRGRQIATEQEHSTRLLVVLNSDGTITNILIQGTSGVYDLDQAAVDAFNKAGPFPNPPKGMADADGKVKVEWEFVLKT